MTDYSNHAEQAAFNMKQRLMADSQASQNQAKDAAQRMRARIEGGGRASGGMHVGKCKSRHVTGVHVHPLEAASTCCAHLVKMRQQGGTS